MRAPISGWPIEFSAPIAAWRTAASASPSSRAAARRRGRRRAARARPAAGTSSSRSSSSSSCDQRRHGARDRRSGRARRPPRAACRRRRCRSCSISRSTIGAPNRTIASISSRLHAAACRAVASAPARPRAPRSQPSTVTNARSDGAGRPRRRRRSDAARRPAKSIARTSASMCAAPPLNISA